MSMKALDVWDSACMVNEADRQNDKDKWKEFHYYGHTYGVWATSDNLYDLMWKLKANTGGKAEVSGCGWCLAQNPRHMIYQCTHLWLNEWHSLAIINLETRSKRDMMSNMRIR